jgi:hypothetical protein
MSTAFTTERDGDRDEHADAAEAAAYALHPRGTIQRTPWSRGRAEVSRLFLTPLGACYHPQALV